MSSSTTLLPLLLIMVKSATGVLRCDDTWFQMLDKCFYFEREPDTFKGAEHSCRVLFAGRLAMIKSERLQNHLEAFIQKLGRTWANRMWIGAHSMKDQRIKFNYTWVDGTPVDFESFIHDHNDLSEDDDSYYIEKCVSVFVTTDSRAGKWTSLYCGIDLPFLCEKDAIEVREDGTLSSQDTEVVIAVNPILVALIILLSGTIIFVIRHGNT